MTDRLHKMVDGARVELSDEEDALVRAEREENEKRRNAAAYIDFRRDEYLPLTELADALTKKASGDPAIRAAGEAQEAAYFAHNLEVKARYPKP